MAALVKRFRLSTPIGTQTVSLNVEQLLQRNRNGDPVVVEALVQQYFSTIHRLALSVLDDPDEAQDATQEAFIAATLNLHRYRGESSLKTWLYAIALNTCRGHLRKRKARQTMRDTWSSLQSLGGGPPTPEETTLRSEADTRLWEAVDALDEKHRVPIILRYAHDLSVPEIAQVMKVNEGTVHSRLHYARRKLQGRLAQAGISKKGQEGER